MIIIYLFLCEIYVVILTISKKNTLRSEKLIKKNSMLLSDDGVHSFRKIKVVPPFVYLVYINKKDFYKGISLWLFDIHMEPLRDNSWQELLYRCILHGEYDYGLLMVDRYLYLINKNKSIYKKREYKKIIKRVEELTLMLRQGIGTINEDD